MAQRRVLILGESPLTEEYSSLFAGTGWQVHMLAPRKGAGGATRQRPAKGVTYVSRIPSGCSLALELTVTDRTTKKTNLNLLDRALARTIPMASSSVTVTVAEQQSWISNAGRLVGIGALPTLLNGTIVELATSPRTDATSASAVSEFLKALGKEPVVIGDSVGMVLPRIIAMLANEACFALNEGVATRSDIDAAMKLGTNYPFGPLEWTERIGIAFIHAVVRSLSESFGEDRYRVAPLLQRAAALGMLPG